MRSTADVFAFCKREHESASAQWSGLCLKFVRSSFGLAAVYPSAAAAWKAADHRHSVNDGNLVPKGVPVFWLGGPQGFGHIAVSIGGGLCWTTDFKRRGDVDLARINDITRGWGQDLVGWSEDLNNVRVWAKPVARRTPRVDRIVELAREVRQLTVNDEKSDDMAKIIDIARGWSAKY